MTWKLVLTFGLSVAAFLAAARFPLAWLGRWPRLWMRLALLFAVLPFVPFIGVEIGGAKRWLNLPGGLHLPVHYLVLTLFMLGAAALSAHPPTTKSRKAEVVVLTFATGFALLVQPNFWGACAFLGMVLIALAIHGRWQPALILGAIPVAGIGWSLLTHPYESARMLGFLHPANDPFGQGYQLLQNLSVFAAAPVFGPLPGSLARQTYLYGDLTWIAARFGLAAASLFIALIAGVVAFGVWRAARRAAPHLPRSRAATIREPTTTSSSSRAESSPARRSIR